MYSNASLKEHKNQKVIKNNKYQESSEFLPFSPRLDSYYSHIFNKLLLTVISKSPNHKTSFLEEMIRQYSNIIEETDLEGNKFLSAVSILRDLLSLGWRIIKSGDEESKLAPPKIHKGDNKNILREQLQHERNSQFKISSIKQFVKKMERTKIYLGNEINVLNLVGDKGSITNAVQRIINAENYQDRLNIASKCFQPYIQLVDNSRCKYTGYKLKDIWRYFRYSWSIPYKSTPGRNLFYLIRDAGQPNHPIMGIAALGNCVLQLSHRDNYIGWTSEDIKKSIMKLEKIEKYEEMIKGQLGLTRNVEKIVELESDEEHRKRISLESTKWLRLLTTYLEDAISDISIEGLVTETELMNPTDEVIGRLRKIAEDLKNKQLNNKRSSGQVDWKFESTTPLYRKKRATELAKLLEAKRTINKYMESDLDHLAVLRKLIYSDKSKALNVALQANRKSKIGSNLMEIIVCGAIPPYNELLCGKLVSLLICSPTVIKDYNNRYSNQISEIASRMKGEEVVRDSRLVFLGTTSLYHMGSSQYNRIKVPIGNNKSLEYKKLGETVGYGSVFFTQETTKFISRMVQLIDGGRKINNVFGEGTSPRLRLIRSGLSALGISSDSYLRHHTKRIIYGIELATNTKEYLNGRSKEIDYLLPLDGNEEMYTEYLIEFWRQRWLINRVKNVNIIERLNEFNKSSLLLSNNFLD